MDSSIIMSSPLVEPASVFSVNGTLHTSIHLTPMTHRIEPNAYVLGNGTLELFTRSLNGTLPGPVLYLNPGDTLIIDFYNDLVSNPEVDETYRHNEFSCPNESNLHFHGLHVSGELPSDDVTMVVMPGDSYRYITTLPLDHMPGTHYIHPHRHGSTALQVGGGAAGAIIVQDTLEIKNQLPEQITQAPELLLMIQEVDLEEIYEIAQESNDVVFQATWNGDSAPLLDITEERFYITNGQISPTVTIQPNEWTRLRILNSGWAHAQRLNLEIPGCEMQLIAKDGIYLPILPRRILKAEIINAGRADVMIQCPFNDTDVYQMIGTTDGQPQPLLTLLKQEEDDGGNDLEDGDSSINVDDSNGTVAVVAATTAAAASPIPRTTIDFPEYLQDLRETPVTPGCSCVNEMNDMEYPEEPTYLHTTFQGAIVERQISHKEENQRWQDDEDDSDDEDGDWDGNGNEEDEDEDEEDEEEEGEFEDEFEPLEHPYHQHVHPFQLISGVAVADPEATDYYQIGDWHDTIDGTLTIRYKPTVFTGKMMIHCHNLVHEDEGMMGLEYIHSKEDGHNECTCGGGGEMATLGADNDSDSPQVLRSGDSKDDKVNEETSIDEMVLQSKAAAVSCLFPTLVASAVAITII